MTDPPADLDVAWGPSGADVGMFPLRLHPGQAESLWMGAARFGGPLVLAAAVPLAAGEMFGALPIWGPPLVLLAIAAIALLVEIALRWRRDNAWLVMRIQPHEVELVHELGPFPVVTTRVKFGNLRTIELDSQGTLRFVHQSGRVVCEPLVGLEPEARTWVLRALGEARKQTAEFWQGQLGRMQERAALEQLTAGVSRPR